MNFEFNGCIYILSLEDLASKILKIADLLSYFEIFELEAKLKLHGLDFKQEFLDENFQKQK